jgi:hypothetical protein
MLNFAKLNVIILTVIESECGNKAIMVKVVFIQ